MLCGNHARDIEGLLRWAYTQELPKGGLNGVRIGPGSFPALAPIFRHAVYGR
jgi:hypothetical protein